MVNLFLPITVIDQIVCFRIIRIILSQSIVVYISHFIPNFIIRIESIPNPGVLISSILIHTHQVNQTSGICYSKSCRNIHFGFTFFTLLCRNQNYAISTTRTVNSSRRSIFQNGDIFNIGRIQRRKGVLSYLKVTTNG